MYNVESLIKDNQHYHYNKLITQKEVDKANDLIQAINLETEEKGPKAGDIVEYLTKHGDFYRYARIERVRHEEGIVDICEQPSIPFTNIARDGKTISLSMSGGSWTRAKIEDLKRLNGERETLFGAWGRMGAEANGKFNLKAFVKVWSYQEDNKYAPYSTKDYNKYFIHDNQKEESELGNCEYRFSGQGFAFRNYRELNAWLLKNRAVVFKGNWTNQLVVFTYIKESQLVSKKYYDKLDDFTEIDRVLMNGSYVQIKRKVDSYNSKIIEYRYENRCEYKFNEHKAKYEEQKFLSDKRNKRDAICVKILQPKEIE